MSPKITVVGLGPGSPEMLTAGALRALESADEVWVRTTRHPTLGHLDLGDRLHSFDRVYNTRASNEQVYRDIAESLVRAVRSNPDLRLVYAVPGSPTTGETSVRLLREIAPGAGVGLEILPGVSALEAAMGELGLDPLDRGVQAMDADDLANLLDEWPSTASQLLNPTIPLLVSGVWQQPLASAVKLLLLTCYPHDWPVRLVRAGLGEPPVEVALEDLDRGTRVDHLTTLYVPPLSPEAPGSSFYQLTHITARLRGPGGCPWDREQTHASIKRHLIEEAYEALEALDSGDIAALEEELGDVLLQVSLHSEIAYTDSDFDIGDVIRGITAKLVRRHPHVFGDVEADTAAQVLANWHEIKQGERADKGEPEHSALDGVPSALPALARAQSVSQRAARTGFDWSGAEEVWHKVREEVDELRSAGDGARLEELGDLLFALVNWARLSGLEAEEALRLATSKFERRFRELERRVRERGTEVRQLPMPELDEIWNQVKADERRGALEVK